MRHIRRGWKQLRVCLILGALILGFGQACGDMKASPHTTNSKDPSSTGTHNGSEGEAGTGTGSTTPPPVPAPPIFQNPGNTNGNSTTNFGYLEYITPAGEVLGEAKNPSNINQSVTVYFFVDGPQGSGASAGQVVASLPSQSNYGGNTRFSYKLPANLRNGEPHTLYVYAFVNNSYVQLANSPMTYAAYTPTAAGQQYYETTLKPLLQMHCSACHQINYEFHYSKLISPTKFQGATATNHDLINKPSGQVVHGGGMRCAGGRASSPCLEIQQWWHLEFGN